MYLKEAYALGSHRVTFSRTIALTYLLGVLLKWGLPRAEAMTPLATTKTATQAVRKPLTPLDACRPPGQVCHNARYRPKPHARLLIRA